MSNGLSLLAREYCLSDHRKKRADNFRKLLFKTYQNQAIQYSKILKEYGIYDVIEEEAETICLASDNVNLRRVFAELRSQKLFHNVQVLELDSTFMRLLKTKFRVFFKDMVSFGATVGLKMLGETRTIPQIKITDSEVLSLIDTYAEEFAIRSLCRFFEAYRQELSETVYLGEVSLALALNKILEGRKFAVILRPHVSWASEQAYNLGLIVQYKKSGVKRHQWVTISSDLDLHDSHSSMNGEIVNVGDDFSSGEAFPSQVNPGCSCSIVPVLEDCEARPWSGDSSGFSINT